MARRRSATSQPVMPGMEMSTIARSGLMLRGEREAAGAVGRGEELKSSGRSRLRTMSMCEASSSISSSLRRGPA